MATEIPLFMGFKWPLPTSFAGPVAAARFELGDVLYREAAAYRPWSECVPHGVLAIQVLDPPRSARGTLRDGDGDRRQSNWDSTVRVLIIDPKDENSSGVERLLSQGKLLTAWWRGEARWLEADCPQPELPKPARALFAELESTRPIWIAQARRRRVRTGCVFALVVDLASDASRAKAQLVLDRLSADGRIKTFDLSPAEVGVATPEAFHPTLIVRGFIVSERQSAVVEGSLRGALYRGGSGQSDAVLESGDLGDDVPTGRFSVARHGILIPLEE